MPSTGKRTLFTDEKLKEILEVLNDISASIEDVFNEPDDRSRRSMTEICATHNINYNALRNLFQSKTFESIRKGKILSYEQVELPQEDPYEIFFKCIFGSTYSVDAIIHPLDFKVSVDYIIENGLTEEQQKVIKLRFGFEDGIRYDLKETGDFIGKSRERVRQIEAKALRKLRYPTYAKVIRDGLYAVNLEKQQEVERLKKAIEEASNKPEVTASLIATEAMNTPIDDLEFTVRTYNCLKRHGCSTVLQLLRMDDAEIATVRNIGKRSMEEISNKLQEYLDKYNITREDLFKEVV